MKRLFGIAASAVVVLGLTAQAPGHARIATLTPAVAATAAAPAPAGLSINGIHGGAVPPSTVESFEWGVSNGGVSNAGSGGGAAKAQFSNLRVTIPIDQTAPAIAAAVASGKHFPGATLGIGGGASIALTDVRVVAVKWTSGTSGTSATVDLLYARIEWTMGANKAGFDLMRNAAQ